MNNADRALACILNSSCNDREIRVLSELVDYVRLADSVEEPHISQQCLRLIETLDQDPLEKVGKKTKKVKWSKLGEIKPLSGLSTLTQFSVMNSLLDQVERQRLLS